jgi:hypothetical protein
LSSLSLNFFGFWFFKISQNLNFLNRNWTSFFNFHKNRSVFSVFVKTDWFSSIFESMIAGGLGSDLATFPGWDLDCKEKILRNGGMGGQTSKAKICEKRLLFGGHFSEPS